MTYLRDPSDKGHTRNAHIHTTPASGFVPDEVDNGNGGEGGECPDDCKQCPECLELVVAGLGGSPACEGLNGTYSLVRSGCDWWFSGWFSAHLYCSSGNWYLDFTSQGKTYARFRTLEAMSGCPPLGSSDIWFFDDDASTCTGGTATVQLGICCAECPSTCEFGPQWYGASVDGVGGDVPGSECNGAPCNDLNSSWWSLMWAHGCTWIGTFYYGQKIPVTLTLWCENSYWYFTIEVNGVLCAKWKACNEYGSPPFGKGEIWEFLADESCCPGEAVLTIGYPWWEF